jgi:hypothetical protein
MVCDGVTHHATFIEFPHRHNLVEHRRTIMNSLLLQFLVVVAFGAFCFGCGYLTAFVVTRNQWRDEMIKRGVARYNWQSGSWNGASRRNNRDIECPLAASRRPGLPN